MSIFDDIRRDREAGTPGPWTYTPWHVEEGNPCVRVVPDGWIMCSPPSDLEARRIARVPDLERIALAAEELAKECDRIAPVVGEAIEAHGLGDKHGIATANAFRAALAAFQDTTR